MKSSITISESLKAASQFLDSQDHHQLVKDVELVCQQLVNPNFGIAVLAPFNFGKSTLINALLGKEIMPVKMVRTTGTVIRIKYGKTLTTTITLKSGEVIRSSDTEILKEFAVLNLKGQRREDVVSVEVLYPHDLLKNGVEILDLPGTNDREEQDALVRDQLLQVDLVIQILNARQPFTLNEQETLTQWLDCRGIKTVVFVLNRLNELETLDDKNEVYNDVRSTTDLFNSDLPQGLKNLYHVDALPALKAKQERNSWQVLKSGIMTFEATLFTITSLQKTNTTRLARVIALATKVKAILQKRADDLTIEIKNAEIIRNIAIEEGKNREVFLKEELKRRVEVYRNWLSLNTLVASYQLDAGQALEIGQFGDWQNSKFHSTILSYTQTIEKWVNQSCNEFQRQHPNSIKILFPSYPDASLPKRQDRNAGQWIGDLFSSRANRKKLDKEYERKKWQAYKDAAYNYFSVFSKNALSSLNEYEKNAELLIIFPIPRELPNTIRKRNDLRSINSVLSAIQHIELQRNTTNIHRFKYLEHLKVFLIFWKNWLSHSFKSIIRAC
jgi:Dynamin family